jgi:hypothetical protein
MEYNKNMDVLKQIKEVDAPPFLLTRIKQQIQNQQLAEAPLKWKWSFALAFAVVLALNISTLLGAGNIVEKKHPGVENIVNSLGLSATNDLYYE